MKTRLEDKYKAIELRKKGFTYGDIMKEIPVSKSLLSGWFKLLELSKEEEEQLRKRAQENNDKGNSRAALSNRNKRISREKSAFEEALVIFETFKSEPNFILGIGLFWAEGSKRTSSLHFVNSDPGMIRFMIFWFKKYLKVTENRISLRIFTHEDFRLDKYEEFWQNELGFSAEQFKKTCYKPNTRHGIFKKNPLYKGCARIEISRGLSDLRKIIGFIRILENSLKDVMLSDMRP
jgi:hypothetical protein